VVSNGLLKWCNRLDRRAARRNAFDGVGSDKGCRQSIIEVAKQRSHATRPKLVHIFCAHSSREGLY